MTKDRHKQGKPTSGMALINDENLLYYSIKYPQLRFVRVTDLGHHDSLYKNENKGKAVKWLVNYLKFELNSIVAIGDD